MKFTLLHPSRGRSEKAAATHNQWVKNHSGKTSVEHILSIDMEDNQTHAYIEHFKQFADTKIIADKNNNVVQATNRAAKYATGNVLIYMSDDFIAPEAWDLKILNAMFGVFENPDSISGVANSNPLLLKVSDGLQPFHAAVLTIPIMSKALYKRLGYFWHPGYASMFVDEDLYWTCKNNKWLIEAPELTFWHQHHTNTPSVANDETYRRSAANWNSGKLFFAKRKETGFPLA